ncbi:hypothetical protein KC352_g25974, partial [Hortaea werneckii]
MQSHERGRSPSGQANHIRHSTSASPHPHPHPHPHPPLDAASFAPVSTDSHFTSDAFSTNPSNHLSTQAASGIYGDPSFTQDFSQQAKWSLGPTFQGFGQQESQQTQA